MKNYFVIILWLLVSCASQGYPSGGPIDDQGPVIINITPSSEDLSKNESIIIEFDENIDPNSISSAIRINQDDNFKLRVYKNKITIKPIKYWNDTVELYISRRIQDYQGNKMDEAITKIFNKSSIKIKDGIIRGNLINVLDDKIYEVGLYEVINDSVVFIKKTESNINGEFEFINVNYGDYRIASIEGDLSDFNYDYRMNRYAMQSQDISINNDIFELNLKLMVSDPLDRASIVSAKMLNPNHALLTLSDESTKSVFINSDKGSKKYSSGDSIKLDVEHYNRLESYFMPSFEFIANFKKDTLAPQIKNFIFDKNLYLTFEEPVKLLSQDIFFYKNSPLRYKLLNPFEVEVSLTSDFINEVIIIENSIMDYENNKIDSVLNITSPSLDLQQKYGSMKGNIVGINTNNIVVRITHQETGKQYFDIVDNNFEFLFERIIPGKYTLDSYELKDNKEVYFSGIWIPYQQASRFSVYPEYIDVRAHWEIEGIELKFN